VRGAISVSGPVSLVAVAALGGFLFVTAASSVTETRRAEAPRRARLVRLIEERRRLVADLERDVRELEGRVAGARRSAAARGSETAALTARAERLALLAGVTPLHGPGLEVRLADSTRPAPAGADASAYRIHDRDLQLVVNALFAAGAEAVAVNGIRLSATTPIRAAGATIVVGFRPVAPPFVVAAIGARRSAFEESEIARRFGRWREVFGLGFRVREVGDLTVPGSTGRVGPGSARPGEA
jgi:uncharacterized protein YlxW (UPF0749 family)